LFLGIFFEVKTPLLYRYFVILGALTKSDELKKSEGINCSSG